MNPPEPTRKIVMVAEPSKKRKICMIDKDEFADGHGVAITEGDSDLFGGSDDPLDWSDGN
jgi:hypothetical protein